MADDHAQRTLEQKALTNVRAQLDREDPDAPARSIGEAAAHMAKTLPIALAAVAAAIALLVWLTPRAPEKPKTRAMYAVGVSQQVEYYANGRRRSSSLEGLRGTARISFRVRPDGNVEGSRVEVVQSSGDQRVDQAARDLPLAVQPFGRFGAGADTTPLEIRGTLVFETRSILFRLDP